MSMLSRGPNELARRSTWTCLSCSSLSRTSMALIAVQQRPSPQKHQRKYSSSKTSSSPKEDHRAIAASTDPASKTISQEAKAAPTEVAEAPEKRSSGRSSKRKPKEGARDGVNKANSLAQLNLPSVPSTQNLHPLNVHLASFFSTHRPLSITNAIPPPASTSAFSSLFEAKAQYKPSASDVIYTLSSAVDNLENTGSHLQQHEMPEEINLRTAVTQASASNAHLTHDHNLPAKDFHIDLQDLAKNFRPYTPPPPPVPMGALQEAAGKTFKAEKRSRPTERTSYKTTLTIYESTHADGQRSYETHSSPLVIDPSPTENEEYLPSPRLNGQSFLGRMRERQIKYEDRVDERFGSEAWQLISVKRQRKLKMKKHKYKKLMKRTKNLRRRQDRL